MIDFASTFLNIGDVVVCNTYCDGATTIDKKLWHHQANDLIRGCKLTAFLVIGHELTLTVYEHVRHYITDKGVLSVCDPSKFHVIKANLTETSVESS